MSQSRKIRVLVVDDSVFAQKMIIEVLRRDPEIEVVGTALDPYVARDKIESLNPDVLTLDIEMPKMDGVSFLKILQEHHPLPVLVISSLTQEGSRMAFEALQAGALDVMAKPGRDFTVREMAAQLPLRIKAAAASRRLPKQSTGRANQPGSVCQISGASDPRQIILIGASTGGPAAIRQTLAPLPPNLPGICVVQHIPPHFSKLLAEWFDRSCPMEVREAVQGDEVRPGLVLIAPGGSHMVVHWQRDRYRVSLNQTPPVNHCRPSVDVLFESAAVSAGHHALAILLTGMGNDGASGMKQLKDSGAHTIVQDQETSVVHGMPRAAFEMGAATQVLALPDIPAALCAAVRARALASLSASRDERAVG